MGEGVDELCRLCAGFDPVKMPIFSTEGHQRNLVNKILTCLRFRVCEDDGFPSSVCYKCMFNLENFYDFYESTLRAQSALHSKILDSGGKAELMIATAGQQQLAPTPMVRKEPPQALHPPQPPPAHQQPPMAHMQGGGPSSIAGVPNIDRPFPCDLCPTSYMSAKDRWTHVSHNHKGDARITCIFCRKGFSTISNLNFHKKNKHVEEMEEWEKKAKPLPKLQKIHDIPKMQNKTYETVRNFLSNKTESMLQDARQSDLANFNVKIGNTDIKFGGPQKPVENRSMIDRLKNLGVEVSTGNVKNNQLQYVDKFNNPEDLLELDFSGALDVGDNLENMIESETVFGCEVCMRDFKDRSSLWLHMLYSHKNEAGFTCGMCLKLCSNFQQLYEHVRTCKEMNESEKRRYFCSICFRQHESKKKLETHTMIHNVDDPWLREHIDLNNLIGVNPTATEKLKQEENMENSESDAYSHDMDTTNDSTQHSQQSGMPAQGFFNRQDALAYQSFLESSGHFLESSAFFDDVKVEPEVKLEVDESNKFRCDECFRTYDTAMQLQKHKYNVHKNVNRLQARNDSFGNPVYECEYCGETYETAKLLMKHRYNVHRNPQTGNMSTPGATTEESPKGPGVACPDCPRSFDTPRQLQKHRYNVHKPARKLMPQLMMGGNGVGGESPVSGDSTNLVNKPAYHYSYSFDCEICGERLASKTERWKHCYKNHKEDTRLLCEAEDCKKVMPTESFKKEHETFHTQQGKFPICCEICAKMWTNKVEFWKHISGVHYSLIGLTCGVCMKMFIELDELKEHVKSHEPLTEAEFNCEICGRGYSSKPKMTRHRLIHEHNPEADEYNILKNTLMKGGVVNPRQPTILNIPKVNRSFENDLEVIEVNPDEALDGEHEEGVPDHLWCDVCPDLTFSDLDELRTHRRNIHALYPCDLCPKFYGGVSHLWKHTNRSHKGHPDITCELCHKTSASRVQLKGHMNKNHKEVLLGHMVGDSADPDPTNLNCQRCGREFKIRSLVRRHERACLLKDTFDPDPTNLNCQKCGKWFSIRSQVRKHERSCLNREPLSLICNVCGKEFPKRSYCRRHERTCGTKKERPPKEETPTGPMQCEWCPKSFSNRRAYVGHVDYMHSVVECEICTEEKVTFRSKVDLYNHCKEKHPGHAELVCSADKCGILLRSKGDLDKHMRDHKNRDNPPVCEFCADVFKGRKKLRVHILHQHKNENGRKFICGICVKVMEDTPSLISHIYEVHGAKTVERDYTCRICARPYNCNTKVLDHIRNTHDGTYKPCKLCLKVFTDDDELEKHIRDHALKDSNQCSICQEVFETVVLLYEHVQKEHPNLKENSCLICGKKYHSAYTCFEHMDNKHGGVFTVCRKCSQLFTDPEEKAKHMAAHGSEEEEASLTCTKCSVKCDNADSLKQHIKEVHAELFEELADRDMCLLCSKTLKYKYSVWVHISKHHKEVHGCRTCLMVYDTQAELDGHVIKMHTKDKDGNPPLYSPANLIKGKAVKAKKPNNQCCICQGTFGDTEEVRKHIASTHPEALEKDTVCALCGHTYSSRFKVYYHVATVHGNPYKCCRKCAKVFMSQQELDEHAANHPEEEPKPKTRKRKGPDEEPTVEERRTSRPRRSRSKAFSNYVVDMDEVADEDDEGGDEEADESDIVGSPEVEGTVVDPDVPSEDEDESDEEGEGEGEESEDGEEEEDSGEDDDDDAEDAEGDEEEDETSGDGPENYTGEIAAKVGVNDEEEEEEEDDDYTCEAGEGDNFKIKIKHNTSFKKEPEPEPVVEGSRLRKRKRSDVVNGTEEVKRIVTDANKLASCVAE